MQEAGESKGTDELEVAWERAAGREVEQVMDEEGGWGGEGGAEELVPEGSNIGS